MQSAGDNLDLKLRLLSSIDLDDVTSVAAEIVDSVTSSEATAILMWDSDLETFGDRFLFGSKKKEIIKLCDALYENMERPKEQMSQLDLDDLGVTLHKDLDPVFCYQILREDELCALIVIAGSDGDAEKMSEDLSQFEFARALFNAWEFRELQRENERLRSQYEEMEDKTSMLEEQTIKLIHDITSHNTIRTRQVERERLVYSISNVVRSSVHIQEVLDTTVREIGKTFQVSRCLLLRSVENADKLAVFEYSQETAGSVKELFFSDLGFDFTRDALGKKNPHDLVDPDLDTQCTYDIGFLKQLGIRSGLIVPLVLRERVLGVLFLQDCVEPRNWSIDDVSLIGSLADNVSVAIENAELHLERERQAVTDGLTGIANRRSFNETFSREFERARRYGESLSLVVIDLDFLKKINDTYGHQAGDAAIQTIGRLLKQSSRSIDLPARYGGEEFCLLLPNTELDMAQQLAERLRRLINEVEVEGPGRISASLGVACYPLHADDPDLLFHKADEALYVAKQSGRNQVKVATAGVTKSLSIKEKETNNGDSQAESNHVQEETNLDSPQSSNKPTLLSS